MCAFVCMHVWVRLGLGVHRQSVSTAASSPLPCLIQQPLYPEVRGLDPLMWPLWRGVNHQQLNSLQGDFRAVGLWSGREGLYLGEGNSLVWENAWAWAHAILMFPQVARCFKFLTCHLWNAFCMVGGFGKTAAGLHTLTVKAPIWGWYNAVTEWLLFLLKRGK